ncbi:uncharacterized protein DUF4305 [Salsuginibacillus halophilus]|uniref:Uncharacterized protein DUF4305 n=1 Tax=Salsuginibacillus halophilus TaxID=517424 RepID=A0A2P8HL82_9BACI|nr:YdiK family protein [Salsuginibacillus halophilus]PSL46940.1 uncharacterized protein DUF4305 [Salsuginibacillus halophilus]
MKMSHTATIWIYTALGMLFLFLAIESVSAGGWDVWSIMFAAVAAIDFAIVFRAFQAKKAEKQNQNQ